MGDHDGWTPIMVGSQNGHNDVLDLLLKAKVNPNACLTPRTLMSHICGVSPLRGLECVPSITKPSKSL